MKTTTYDETKWKMVPIEPTKKMLDAAAWIARRHYRGRISCHARSRPTAPAVASLICPKCGVDRYKVACPSDLMNCPIRGEAQSAAEQPDIDPCPQCTPGSYCATATCGRRAQMQSSAPPCGDAAYEALRELVRLKDIKDRINRSQTVTSFEVDDYRRNKPKVWEAARRAVARQQDSVGSIVASAYRLVEDARKSGMLVRIDLVSRQPLAMGNIDMIVDVRPARAPAMEPA